MTKNISHSDTLLKMPGMSLPVRSTLVNTKEKVILISPGTCLTEQDFKKFGNVTDIVAPNLFHLNGIPNAAKAFPQAKVWGVQGADKKRPDISWSGVLSETTWPYQNDLQLIIIDGMPKVNEAVFVHKESQSLIAADLFFNMVDAKGFGPWLVLSLFGTYQKLGVSRFILKFMSDPSATKISVAKLMKTDFDRLVPSHGKIIESGGKPKLQAAFMERKLI